MNRQPHHTSTASPPARSQRRRLWGWLLVIAALVSLIAFLPQCLLIQWGPRLLGTVLSKQLHTSVTVQGVAGGWLSGLEIRGIEVAEGPELPAPRLLRLERLTLNLAAVWLLASSEPVVLHLEDLTVNLRRGDDGQWNLAALLAHLHQPTPSTAPRPSQPLSLPDRRLDVTLTGGRLYMEDNGTTYGFDLHAESASLATAPWQWHFTLSGPARAALTMDGELQHLAASEPLAGHIEVNVSQLDIGVMTSLLPLPAAVQFHGRVPNAHARLMFAGTQGVTIAAGLEFQQLQWQVGQRAGDGRDRASPDTPARTVAGEPVVMRHPDHRSAAWPLSAKHDRAWMQADEDAWRGHAAFALDVQDSQLVTQALQTLLPPALHIQGPLQITGKVDGGGEPRRAATLGCPLNGPRGQPLESPLAQITWRQEAFTKIITKAFLKEGILTIPQVSARAFGSDIVLHGDLPLAEDAPGGGIDWRLTNLPLHKVLGAIRYSTLLSRSSAVA